MSRLFLSLFFTASVIIFTDGWWDAGHWIAATIARLTLEDEELDEVVSLTQDILDVYQSNWPDCKEMGCASVWLDDIKSSSTNLGWIVDAYRGFDNIHFMNIPIEQGVTPDNDAVSRYVNNATLVNIHTFFAAAIENLVNPSNLEYPPDRGTVFFTALNMRLLLHLIGDAHMPCHTCSMWFKGEVPCAHASGCSGAVGGKYSVDSNDRGCNQILVNVTTSEHQGAIQSAANNLHAYWDSMSGYGNGRWRDVTVDHMESVARDVMTFYSKEKALKDGFNVDEFSVMDVYEEVFAVAARGTTLDGKIIDSDETWSNPDELWTVYAGVDVNEHFCPQGMNNEHCKRFDITPAYQKYAESASKRQVALAGYRLASTLKKIKTSIPARLVEDIKRVLASQEEPGECPACTQPECPEPEVCTQADCPEVCEQTECPDVPGCPEPSSDASSQIIELTVAASVAAMILTASPS